MTFINTRLDPKISVGFVGGPEWSTAQLDLKSGVANFYQRWSMPRHRYQGDYTQLVAQGLGEGIVQAFMVARGRARRFRFKDHRDFRVSNQIFGTGNGTSNPIQLFKRYTFGTEHYDRRIVLPVGSTIVVTENDVPKAVTVNENGGTVTPVTPWTNAAVLRWTGEFDVEVYFGSDYYPFNFTTKTITQCTIDLVEYKRP